MSKGLSKLSATSGSCYEQTQELFTNRARPAHADPIPNAGVWMIR